MTTPRQTTIELAMSASDSIASAINAYELPRMPAVSLMHASTALVASPTIVARTPRSSRDGFTCSCSREMLPRTFQLATKKVSLLHFPFARQHGQNCLLHMQAILRLVKNGLLMGFKNIGGNLFPNGRGQTMHHQRLRLGGPHHVGIDLVTRECLGPLR